MGTKERIVEAAIRLFNETGTAAVSTNHIAEEAGISPGNLYYHFGNKEEIIRAIWARADAYWEEAYALPADREPTVDDLRVMVEDTFSGLWSYRFFYREAGALTQRDPELARRFKEVRERGVFGTEALLRRFAEAGVIGETDDAAFTRLANVLMLVAEFWLPFEETGGKTPGPGRAGEGADLLMEVLRPRLTVGKRR